MVAAAGIVIPLFIILIAAGVGSYGSWYYYKKRRAEIGLTDDEKQRKNEDLERCKRSSLRTRTNTVVQPKKQRVWEVEPLTLELRRQIAQALAHLQTRGVPYLQSEEENEEKMWLPRGGGAWVTGDRERLMLDMAALARKTKRLWRGKRGDVVDELVENLAFPDTPHPHVLLREVCDRIWERFGSQHPTKNSLTLALMLLYTQEIPDTDRLLLMDAPVWAEGSRPNRDRWDEYVADVLEDRTRQGGCIRAEMDAASGRLLGALHADDRESEYDSEHLCLKWVKLYCVLAALTTTHSFRKPQEEDEGSSPLRARSPNTAGRGGGRGASSSPSKAKREAPPVLYKTGLNMGDLLKELSPTVKIDRHEVARRRRAQRKATQKAARRTPPGRMDSFATFEDLSAQESWKSGGQTGGSRSFRLSGGDADEGDDDCLDQEVQRHVAWATPLTCSLRADKVRPKAALGGGTIARGNTALRGAAAARPGNKAASTVLLRLHGVDTYLDFAGYKARRGYQEPAEPGRGGGGSGGGGGGGGGGRASAAAAAADPAAGASSTHVSTVFQKHFVGLMDAEEAARDERARADAACDLPMPPPPRSLRATSPQPPRFGSPEAAPFSGEAAEEANRAGYAGVTGEVFSMSQYPDEFGVVIPPFSVFAVTGVLFDSALGTVVDLEFQGCCWEEDGSACAFSREVLNEVWLADAKLHRVTVLLDTLVNGNEVPHTLYVTGSSSVADGVYALAPRRVRGLPMWKAAATQYALYTSGSSNRWCIGRDPESGAGRVLSEPHNGSMPHHVSEWTVASSARTASERAWLREPAIRVTAAAEQAAADTAQTAHTARYGHRSAHFRPVHTHNGDGGRGADDEGSECFSMFSADSADDEEDYGGGGGGAATRAWAPAPNPLVPSLSAASTRRAPPSKLSASTAQPLDSLPVVPCTEMRAGLQHKATIGSMDEPLLGGGDASMPSRGNGPTSPVPDAYRPPSVAASPATAAATPAWGAAANPLASSGGSGGGGVTGGGGGGDSAAFGELAGGEAAARSLRSLQGTWHTEKGVFATVSSLSVTFTSPSVNRPVSVTLRLDVSGRVFLGDAALVVCGDDAVQWTDGDVWRRARPHVFPPPERSMCPPRPRGGTQTKQQTR